jgi:hypothetical protein
VRPVLVVVGHVFGEDSFEMSTTENQNPVQTLTTQRADESLGEGTGPRSPDWL